jgi:hypothetical protein
VKAKSQMLIQTALGTQLACFRGQTAACRAPAALPRHLGGMYFVYILKYLAMFVVKTLQILLEIMGLSTTHETFSCRVFNVQNIH